MVHDGALKGEYILFLQESVMRERSRTGETSRMQDVSGSKECEQVGQSRVPSVQLKRAEPSVEPDLGSTRAEREPDRRKGEARARSLLFSFARGFRLRSVFTLSTPISRIL